VIAGLTYLKGPPTLAATFETIDTHADERLTLLTQRHEIGTAIGGCYRLAPGVQVVAEHQYLQRHQGGFDFNQGAPGLNGTTRDARLHGLTFATVLTW
jgi:hypothetical protein